MRYFIDEQREIYAYEDDGSQDVLIGSKQEISEEDALNLVELKLTSPDYLVMPIDKKKQLRLIADAEIAWLQDAIDTGIASNEEASLIVAWKHYRVELMRVDTSKGMEIIWPLMPQE